MTGFQRGAPACPLAGVIRGGGLDLAGDRDALALPDVDDPACLIHAVLCAEDRGACPVLRLDGALAGHLLDPLGHGGQELAEGVEVGHRGDGWLAFGGEVVPAHVGPGGLVDLP